MSFRACRMAALLILVTATGGCATTRAFQAAVPPDNEKALVYIIRKSCPPYIREDDLTVNGERVATIANNAYVAVNVPTGSNLIDLQSPGDHNFAFELDTAPGETDYIVITGDVQTLGTSITGMNQLEVDLQWHFAAYKLDKDKAEALMKSL